RTPVPAASRGVHADAGGRQSPERDRSVRGAELAPARHLRRLRGAGLATPGATRNAAEHRWNALRLGPERARRRRGAAEARPHRARGDAAARSQVDADDSASLIVECGDGRAENRIAVSPNSSELVGWIVGWLEGELGN